METIEQKDQKLSVDLFINLEKELFELVKQAFKSRSQKTEGLASENKLPGASKFRERVMRKIKKYPSDPLKNHPKVIAIKKEIKEELKQDLKKPLNILLEQLEETTQKFSIICNSQDLF